MQKCRALFIDTTDEKNWSRAWCKHILEHLQRMNLRTIIITPYLFLQSYIILSKLNDIILKSKMEFYPEFELFLLQIKSNISCRNIVSNLHFTNYIISDTNWLGKSKVVRARVGCFTLRTCQQRANIIYG